MVREVTHFKTNPMEIELIDEARPRATLRHAQLDMGPTSMKEPPIGFPSPVSCANWLMLKFVTEVFEFTNVC